MPDEVAAASPDGMVAYHATSSAELGYVVMRLQGNQRSARWFALYKATSSANLIDAVAAIRRCAATRRVVARGRTMGR